MNDAPPAPERVVSLDALRGFTMLWILGGGGLAKAMKAFGDAPPAQFLAEQFEHVRWEGFHFEDLIFPMFVFIAGASLVFSLGKKQDRAMAVRRVIFRALVLFALGVIYNGGFANGLAKVRWLGVLQRIALAYCGAGLLFLFLKPRGLLAALIALLAGYWMLLTFAPVPEVGAGHFAERENFTDYFDREHLPGRRYGGDHDPEGILSTFPAIGTCLLGVFAGMLLQGGAPARKKVAVFIGGGVALVAAGWAWDAAGFPIIKKIWTSSFVLMAAGWSAVLLGTFYGIIDVLGARRWAQPFVWIGMNPITLYFFANLVDVAKLSARFIGGDLPKTLNSAIHPGTGELVTALFGMCLSAMLARFLYRRKIFLRV